MQEIFEKIIEKLEELKKCGTKHYEDGEYIYTSPDYDHETLNKAIEIVKQAAAEYSNGWIPCSSGRLPEENKDVEVTVEETLDVTGRKRYYNVRSWLQDGQWVIKKNPYKPTVIAWKYPTEPYQTKGE